ncbi:PP2C family protein-serine/threonine phosphatase [Rubrivirga marina]|uniref:PPM-type phosphatase domain-containing protein n=1 Tax=Rubrivirga marina TaxID=1196024 RepID=A0A271IZ59_9BACT|nr:protein phosphatase 2C domain-containing protein [Rubrivirga marina]PAP76526.1 hypothetical protein BSZ37_08770 [Rubrivirga marina]
MAAPAPPDPFDLDVAIVSDVGNVREQNEDRGRCVRPGDAATLGQRGVLVLVADGMGGHEAGDVASATAADVVAETYYAAPGTPREALGRAFVSANARIHAAAAQPGREGMGTTCTALAVRGAEAFWAHVGDSRLYRLRDGQIERLTTDHSMVEEMVAEGLLTPEEARHHDARNVITRALGIRAETDPALSGPLAVAPGDVFVLMSDGLYDLVDDAEIGHALEGGSAHAAAAVLVETAKARGGYDNVTVAVVQVRTATAARPARPTAEGPTS